jgi:D-serine deaminase-like pyridoxal phosphate-dependent protein
MSIDFATLHEKIDTPALIIEHSKLDKNIRAMQELSASAGVRLRPHLKTHKSVWITHKQLKAGASGVTVAKLSEAEVMVQAGIKDILIANQITQSRKLHRLKQIHRQIRLLLAIDHPIQIDILHPLFVQETKKLEVMIEINSGLNRCGVNPGEKLIELADRIIQSGFLTLSGIFTHAGQVYAAHDAKEVKQIGEHEGKVIEKAYNALIKKNIKVPTISVGATPTVKYSAFNAVVNEIRPGNYVFYDNIQCHLQSCHPQDCALLVLATVISQPSDSQVIIDAGSKALGLDRGAHATQLISGYGLLLNINGQIERLSEEHGIIQLAQRQKIQIGSHVAIIPNHACAVVNLYNQYYLLNTDGAYQIMPVDARGCTQ